MALYGDDELDQLVLRKLTQHNDPNLSAEERGLGWPVDEAEALYQQLVAPLDDRYERVDPAAAAERAHGLDYEDGRVFGLLLVAKGDRAWSEPVLVTHDRHFADIVNGLAPVLYSGRPEWRAMTASRLLQAYASELAGS